MHIKRYSMWSRRILKFYSIQISNVGKAGRRSLWRDGINLMSDVLPDPGKLRRGKVTKCSATDENFPRRNLFLVSIFPRRIFSPAKFFFDEMFPRRISSRRYFPPAKLFPISTLLCLSLLSSLFLFSFVLIFCANSWIIEGRFLRGRRGDLKNIVRVNKEQLNCERKNVNILKNVVVW